jgi:hypothetical protein
MLVEFLYLEEFVTRPGVGVSHVDVRRLVDLVGDDGVDEAGGRQLLFARRVLLGRRWRRPRHVGRVLLRRLGRHLRQLPHVLHVLLHHLLLPLRVLLHAPAVVVLPASTKFRLIFSLHELLNKYTKTRVNPKVHFLGYCGYLQKSDVV